MDRTLATGSRHGRRLGFLAATGAGLALVVAACGASTATPTPAPSADAYAVVSKAVAAPMDKLKVNVGVTTTGGSSPITIDPKSIELVTDTTAGKGTFHLSLPKAALGSDASALPITGDTIDLDVLFDGQAVYIKSPLAAQFLPLLLMQTGQQVPGDLTGWIKLGTAEELGGIVKSLGAGASAQPSMPAMASLTPDELKQKLQDAGITVTFVGTEQHNGVDADHLTISVDPTKLEGSDIFKQVPAGQLGQLKDLAGKGTVSGDVWFDHASGRLSEADINLADTASGSTGKITVLLSDPGTVSIDTPANAPEVPITPLVQMLLQLGGSMMPGASANP
jgi:uncharacterized protein YidB (DUF937 family)